MLISSMPKRLVAAAAAGALVFAACGGDDDGGGSGAKDRLYDELVGGLEADGGLEGLDQDCLRSAVDEIPDDQAEILADNIDSPDIPEGVDPELVGNLTSALFECIDIDALLGEG